MANERNTPYFPRQGWRAFRTESEMRTLIDEYFEMEKKDNNSPPFMSGIACYLGVCSKTLCEYASGVYDDEVNRYSELLGEAKTYIEYVKSKGAYTGQYNANFAKFDLGWNHGWAERKDVTVTPNGVMKHEDINKKDFTTEEALKLYQDTIKRATAETAA